MCLVQALLFSAVVFGNWVKVCEREESQQRCLKSVKRHCTVQIVPLCAARLLSIVTLCIMVSVRVKLQKRNLHPSEINRLEFEYLD